MLIQHMTKGEVERQMHITSLPNLHNSNLKTPLIRVKKKITFGEDISKSEMYLKKTQYTSR
jgi:hypothetical protein